MLKGAIIGAGKIAETAHAPAYLTDTISKKIEIIAIADISAERSVALGNIFPHAKIYNSPSKLIDSVNLDFVDICLPPHLHAEVIEKAVEKNLHIICEKPLANSMQEADLINNAIKNKQLVFFPCHQYKYAPVWKAFKKELQKLNNSKVYLQFNVVRSKADSGFDTKMPNWRIDKNISGGGILADTGVHYIYLCEHLIGKPDSIYAKNLILHHNDYGVEDTALIHLENESGIAEINLTWAGNTRYNSAMLVNNEVSMFYDGKTIKVINSDGETMITVPDTSDKKTYISLYEQLFQDFMLRISNKNYASDAIDEAFNAINVLNLCYKSSELKATIKI